MTKNPTPPTPPSTTAPRTSIYAVAFVLVMAVSLFVAFLPYPFRFALVVTSAIAIAVAIKALIVSRHEPQTKSLQIMLVVGMIFAGISMMSATASLLIAGELTMRQQCEASALTNTAKDQCRVDFENQIETRFGILLPGFGS